MPHIRPIQTYGRPATGTPMGMRQFLLLMGSSIIFMLPIDTVSVRMQLIFALMVFYFAGEWMALASETGRQRWIYVVATDLRYNFPALLAAMTFVSLFVFVFADADRMEIAIRRPVLYRELQLQVDNAAFALAVFVSIFSATLNYVTFPIEFRTSAIARDTLSPARLRWFFIILYGLTLLSRAYAYASGRTNFTSDTNYAEIFGSLGSIVSLITSQSLYIPALLLVIGRLYGDKSSTIACVTMIILEMIYGGVLGIKSAIILPVAFTLFGFYYAWGRLPKSSILIPIMIVAAAFTNIAYVSRVISVEDPRAKGIELLALATKEATSNIFSPTKDSRADRQDQGYWLSRMNTAIPLLAAMQLVDDEGATLDASPYGNMVLSVVPSFVFPWKPDPFDVNTFGRAVGLISPYDFITAIRPSYLGDLFYAFGWAGIVVGPIMLALMLGCLMRLVEANRICLSFYAMAFFLTIFDIENSVGNSFGSLIKTFLILWIAGHFANVRRSGLPLVQTGRFTRDHV